MAATTFVALQCYNCSTMQVKQQRKSGSKWRCAVCNESQSVRKVFAHGCVAKDLRLFVQSFNMARERSREAPGYERDRSFTSSGEEHRCGDGQGLRRKARVDWSEFLDLEEEDPPLGDEGDDSGPKILTELPPKLFKKPKLQKRVSPPGNGHNNAARSGVGYGNQKNKAQGKEQSGYQPAEGCVRSRSSSCIFKTETQGQEVPEASRTTLPTKICKWNDYLTEEANGHDLTSSSGRVADAACEWGCDSWETSVDDQKVEDDIHPDFM